MLSKPKFARRSHISVTHTGSVGKSSKRAAFSLFAAAAIASALSPMVSRASTLYWDNVAGGAINDGAGAWLGAGLWNNGSPSASWTSGDDAIFGNSGAGGAVTLGVGGTTANSLTFNYFTGTYTLGTAGNNLTIGSGGINKIAGSGALVLASPMVLNAAQTWTNNSTNGFQPVGAVTLNNGGFNLTFDGTGSFNMAPGAGNTMLISGAGGIIKNGTGDLNLDSNPTVAHSFTGDIVVNGGSIGFQTAGVFTGKNTKLNGGYLGGRFSSNVTWTGGLGTGANQIQITGGVSGFSGESNSSSTFQIGGALSTLKWGATGENGATGFFNPTALLLNGSSRMNANGTGPLNNGIDLNGSNRTFTSNHTNWDGVATTGGVINGAVVNTAGTAAGIIRTGIGNLSLIAVNTYNGPTTINGGTLTLRSSGTANSSNALNLGGGILRLVNTAQVERFANGAAVTVSAGGGITYENTATNAINYTETLGGVTLTKGQLNVVLTADHTAVTGSQKLTFGTSGSSNLTQGGGNGTVTFSALVTGPNATKNTIAVFGATPSGAGNIIGPWATVGTAANVQGTSYAAYDASGFVVAATLTAATVDTDLASPSGNYLLNTGSLVTLGATRTVNALQFNGTASTLALSTFKLETYGLFLSGGATNTKIISGGVGGALTTPTGGGNLYITTGQVMTAGSEHQINVPITDNSGTVNLVKSGAGILRLNGVNTFTGDIAINAGTLQIGTNATANGANLNSGNYAGNIFIAAGANLDFQTNSDQILSGIISGDGNLLKRATGTLTLGDDNTYTGKTTIGAITNNPSPTLVVSSFNSYNGGTPLLANSSLGAPTTLANATIEMGSNNSSPNPTLRYAGAAATGETTDRIINFTFNASAIRTLDASGSGLLKFTSPFTTSGGLSTGQLVLTGSGAGEIAGLPFLFGTLTKSGGGTWTLAGPVGSTGVVTLSGATAGSRLNINHSQALGTGNFTISGGDLATIGNTSGADITLTANNAQTWSNNFAVVATNSLNMGTGAVSMGGTRTIATSGAGTFTVGGVVSGATFGITLGGSGTMALTNEASTYTGVTSLGNNVGAVKLQVTKLADSLANSSIGAPAAGANSIIQIGAVSNPATLELIGGTSASSTNRQVRIGSSANGSGGATILNNNTNPAFTLTFSNAAFNVAATGVTSSSRSLTLGGSNTGDNTISGAIIPNTGGAGTTSLIKSGTGTWVLAGANTYQGNTAINDGILKAGANNTIPSGSGKGNVNLNGGASVAGTLDLNGFDLAINGLVGTTNTVLGKVVNNATGTNKTLQVGNNDATSSFAGIIADNTSGTGTVALTKTGIGTQTLSGASTYTGATNVNGGTLLVNGNNSAATGAVTVATSATLGGSGTIGGAVTVQSGGALTPGTSPGQLTVASLTLNSGSATNMELAGSATVGTDYDNVKVTGATLSYGGALTVVNFGGYDMTLANATYDLFDVGGATLSTDFGSVVVNTVSLTNSLGVWSGSSGAISYTFNQVSGDLTVAVPEPSSLGLVAVGGLMAMRRRRRSSMAKAAV